ncbi:putative uncharacterized transposon-derived protein F52C9.6 [Nymphon striatum]|nr:putative uncharacterized transposon-derived protein F52C9.6 [Nymphon striatum]
MKGIVVGGVNINNLRYADDTVLIADSAAQLQELINAVNESGKPYGMTMNVEKTKSMVISKVLPVPRISIMLETEAIKQTSSMVYLGHMVTEDGKNETEIKRRIGIAKDAFNNMANILTSRNLKTETKKRLVKCYIWSTLLYGAETWTLTKIMMTKIKAFEMWIYRRMLKISYTEHRTNEFVLRKIEAKRSLMNTIKKRKCTYFGHIMRKEDGLQRLLLDGGLYSALLQNKLTNIFGLKAILVGGLVTFTVSMFGTVMSTSSMSMLNMWTTLSGIGQVAVNTVSLSLICIYHSCEKTRLPGKYKGIAENLAVLDSAYYLAQIFLSIWTGYIVDITGGNPTTYMIASAVFGLVAIFTANKVIFDVKDIQEEQKCKVLEIAAQN